tara:strand:- start:1061 stop:2551 length:1491 start_codon:yes stop_codon:yes gene_type:complete
VLRTFGGTWGAVTRNIFGKARDSVRQPGSLIAAVLHWQRTDTWAGATSDADPTTLLVAAAAASMAFKDQYHVPSFMRNAYVVRTPRVRFCDTGDALTDGMSQRLPSATCPLESAALWTAPNATIAAAYPDGWASERAAATHWVATRCKEGVQRSAVAYNGTHLLAWVSHLWYVGGNRQTWETYHGTRMCTHAYLEGRVHCGLLQAALRWLVAHVVDPKAATLCDALTAHACPAEPEAYIFGGFSNGGGEIAVLLPLLREYLRRHAPQLPPLEAHPLRVRLLFSQAVGNADFARSYERHFGKVTRYLGRADSFYEYFSELSLTQVNVPTVMQSEAGVCGAGGDVKLHYDCFYECDASNPRQWLPGCVAFFATLLNVADPDGAHISSAARLVGETHLPRESGASFEDAPYVRLALGAAHSVDAILFGGAHERPSVWDAFRGTLLEKPATQCGDGPSSIAAHRSVLVGQIAQWCEASATTLTDADAHAKWEETCPHDTA